MDLSADVDFGMLAQCATHAAATAAAAETPGGEAPPSFAVSAFGPVSQSAFLQAMGLSSRLQRLLASAPDDSSRERLVGEALRLAHPDQMGAVYKALAVVAHPRAAAGGADAQPLAPPPAFEGAAVTTTGSA